LEGTLQSATIGFVPLQGAYGIARYSWVPFGSLLSRGLLLARTTRGKKEQKRNGAAHVVVFKFPGDTATAYIKLLSALPAIASR